MPGQPVEGHILCAQLHEVETHYVDRRTVPHIKPWTECPGCLGHQRPRWNGYLALHKPRAGEIVIAVVTAYAVKHEPRLRDKAVNLRGWHVQLKKVRPEKSAPVKAVLTPFAESAKLPPEPDVVSVLLNVWGFHEHSRPENRIENRYEQLARKEALK